MVNLNLTQKEIKERLENNDEEFISSLYDLIRKYLHQNKWYNEDNVQECITYVISKIDRFDENRGNFTTFVCWLSRERISTNARNNNALKRKGNLSLLSLDSIMYDDNGNTVDYIDSIKDETFDRDKEDIKDIVKYVYENELSDLCKDWLNGKTQMELAQEYNLSQGMISRRIVKEINDIKIKLNL